MSLWVVLMVPVSAFAAVVAMAGPQRMAAESSMDEAADDLATLAVAWRDGHGMDEGPLPAFPPDCRRSQEQSEELTKRVTWEDQKSDAVTAARNASPFDQAALDTAEAELDDAEKARSAYEMRLAEWEAACLLMFEWIAADLGVLGVDVGSLRGFYSDSLSLSYGLPCKISPKVEVHDAVHVTLAADWDSAGWAAAQVWPDGTRMGAESIGRLRRSVSESELPVECEDNLDVLDSEGRALVLTDPAPNSRRLSQSVPGRNVIEG